MYSSIQNSFSAGEISPSLLGHVDLGKWHQGGLTYRNFFANYRGGAASRAGLAYVGMCKQGAPNGGGTSTANPPRDIRFQFNLNQGYQLEFGDQYMRIKSNGAYVVETGTSISNATQANPLVITDTAHGYSNGDWIFISGMQGMTQLNGLTWIVINKTTNSYQLTDLFGTTVNSFTFGAYTSGGAAQRLYTLVTPYAAIDLPYLKFTQSSDTMTLCCVNQKTLTEYPSYELQRFAATNWTLTQDSFAASIAAPAGVAVTANASTTLSTWYSYVVTAVSASGEESVASLSGTVENNDIAINAGSNTVTWNAVAGATSYNIYKATPSYSVGVPVGSLYGYVGSSFGGAFTDNNITADATTVPPVHNDPFARGTIESVTPTAGGTGYTQGSIGYTLTTGTGIGFIGTPVVVGGAFVAFIIENGGSGFLPGDTIAITGGTGATATLTIGPETGTYPSCPAYYQQRRIYANTINNPDTYYMSQPGAYKNMDSSIPATNADAIVGTPWAQQINGIQFMISMPGGLVILSGNGAWQLNGGNSAAITPADQTANPQAYNGSDEIVPPITVNYDILYVQAKGSIVRDLSYNFFVNIYTGTDQTVLSNQLFQGHQILQWAYAEEPYKLIWCLREDGIVLSFTYLKEQDIYAWARHDTNGLFVGVSSGTEPPVDAVYFIVKRFVNGRWVYYSERMDNRLWTNVEQSWCVDSGLSWPMASPNATLTVDFASGTNVVFRASASVFTSGMVGDVIRVGGGKATVTSYISATQVTCNITHAITVVVPNDPGLMPVPAIAGNWTISTPTSVVTGLNHLEGKEVAILADGSVIPNQTVTNGTITLPAAYSQITIGLPFLPQLQTMYLDVQQPDGTMQGKRKNLQAVTVRMEASRGMSVGTNQPDSSTLPGNATVPWTNLRSFKERSALVNAGSAIPLFTGDEYIYVTGDWNERAQVAIQQNFPLPANVLAVVSYFSPGDGSG